MNKYLLSIVIPSYNEMANLQKGILEKLKNYLEKNNSEFAYEIIIVDDGSDDGSRQYVESFSKENTNFKLLKNDHLGKAGAVTAGVLQAKGDYILFTDMDQATPIEELKKILPEIMGNFDIVIGSRDRRKGAPLTRVIMSKGAIVLRSVLIGLPQIKDTQCGFKIFKSKAAQDIFSKLKEIHHGYKKIKGSSVTAGFDIELLFIAKKHGYKIKEVPVNWLYVETRRVSPLKDSIEGVIDLLKIKYNILRGVYK